MRLAFAPYTLKFRNPAGTSRGVLLEKPTYLIKVFDEHAPEHYGLGEAPLFPGLSPEADGRYELKLVELLANVALGRPTDLSGHSSIQFGFEQALLDFSLGCSGLYYPSAFTAGDTAIEINGLVWMGSLDEMTERIEEKVRSGFRCIKLKIGALDWTQEEEMIFAVRRRFSPDKLEIRVDANGGFPMDAALPRLKWLADMGVHSIEQPIPAGNAELMAFLCAESPLPIALDEELIGVSRTEDKIRILDGIRPAYIILKPALCGGFSGAVEWIGLARERGIGWWITSSLESNVGLNALAQFTASLNTEIPQGLGTGNLFTNNFPSPLSLKADRLVYDPQATTDRSAIDALEWRE